MARDRRLLILVLLSAWALFVVRLVGDGVPFDRDILRTDWPVRVYIGQALRAGVLPQWFPYEGLGLQFIGNAEGLFRPLSFLFALPFDALSMVKVEMALCMLLGLVGFAALARQLRLSFEAAAAGAVAFVFSGYSLSLLNNLPYLYPYHLLPWVLWAGHGALTAPRPWAWVAACALAWSQVLLGGDPLGAIFAGAGLVAVVATEGRWKAAGPLSAAALLTAALCLVWVLPAWALFGESSRLGWTPDPTTMALKFTRLPEILFGGVWLDPDQEFSLKRTLESLDLWSHSIFLGASVVLLGATGAIVRDRRAIIWAAMGLLFLWLATGEAGGLHTLARTLFPLLNSFRYPEKFLGFGSLSLAAAVGFDVVRSTPWEVLRGRLSWAAGVVLIAALSSLALGHFFPAWFNLKDGSVLLTLWGLGALSSLGFAAANVGLLRASSKYPSAAWLVPILVFAELRLAGADVPPLLPHSIVSGTPRFCRVARASGAALGQMRVITAVTNYPQFGSWLDAEFWVTATLNLMETDTSALCGLENLGLPNLSGGSGRWLRVLKGLKAQRIANLFNSDLAVVDVEVDPATVLDSGGRYSLVRAPTRSRPRAYDAHAHWVADPNQALAALESLPDGEVVVEGSPVEGEATGPTPGRVEVVRYENGEVELAVDLPEPRIVVLNDLYAPGWKAELDGAEARIYRTNYVVRGVRVPAGQHRLRFSFSTPGLAAGLSVSGLALLLCVLMVGWRFRRRRSDLALAP